MILIWIRNYYAILWLLFMKLTIKKKKKIVWLAWVNIIHKNSALLYLLLESHNSISCVMVSMLDLCVADRVLEHRSA